MQSIKKIKWVAKGMVMLVVALGLAGCAKKAVVVFVPPPQKPTLEQVRTILINKLGYYGGVQVIRLGQDVRIVVRSDYLFKPDSANIRDSYRQAMSAVARLIKTYSKMSVKVSAYTDNQGKETFQQALSTRQAQVVANFLWQHGIDSRLLYAVGYNHLNPVGWNGHKLGRSFNRRVEISFRYYPKFKGYN